MNSKFVNGFIINTSWNGTTMKCIVFPKSMKTMIIFIKIGSNTINHSRKQENAWKYKIHKHIFKWSLIHNNIHELSHEILCFLQIVRKWYIYILYINSFGLPIHDVTFCCIIIFYVSAAEPAIGKSIFVWNWHPRETRLISTQLSVRPSVRLSVTGRSDPLTVITMSILQPPRNEPQRPILLRICFFFNLFSRFVFSEKSKATYLLLFLSFFLD